MFKDLLHNKFLKKEIAILFFFYLTLILSFVLGENSIGGAILDYYFFILLIISNLKFLWII